MGVRCILTHEAGWHETAELIVAPEKCVGGRMNGIQSRGAFCSYAQRYTLLAVLGTTAEVDTDAAPASAPPQGGQVVDTAGAPQPGPLAPADPTDGIPF